ncbi:TetR family transcriptional regulator [Marinobacterium zhoushanense]|uniref:TetR family transcriptional regulator n=1 Tax=Marinobacterium zhoushanense TaxID=1679163 RepID=A0ABQ1K1R0_9GAMM|nr:TetR/AcrR family transcriptional regulator [Marinobacterium zhoushanense]GGB81100.1 TetR family transcriptional regulator [Marinobacterium zhoushanense]
MSHSLQQECSDKGLTAKGLERRRRILDAAKEVFLEQGFENASISDIMKRAGGSMSTLYRCFGNKLGLFEAMMEQSCDDLFASFDQDRIWSDDPESTLYSFGQRFIEMVSRPQAVAMYRLVLSANSAEREQIQALFYNAGPDRIRKLLTVYLERQNAEGRMNIGCCTVAAGQFVEMIKQPWHLKALLDIPYDPALPEQSLRQGVDIFLKGTLRSA